MAKFKFFGRNVLQLVVMAGLLLPIALLTIPLYIVMHSLGLTDTIWSIILPSCVSPFGVFLGRMYAQTSVPDELLEAARIDGAGESRIFFTCDCWPRLWSPFSCLSLWPPGTTSCCR